MSAIIGTLEASNPLHNHREMEERYLPLLVNPCRLGSTVTRGRLQPTSGAHQQCWLYLN